MAQRGEDLSLGDEAAVQLVGVGAVAQELDRDLATELAVDALGEVHHTHAAATELAHDAVGANATVAQRLHDERRCRGGQSPLEDSGGRLVRGEQRLDPGA
jgi:hypothetical protein